MSDVNFNELIYGVFLSVDDPYAMQFPKGIWVKQNIDSGFGPIYRGDSDAWRAAAANGTFNYTACSYCNLIEYSSQVSSSPTCDGICIYTDYLYFTDCIDDVFTCGSCMDRKVMFTPEFGWSFNDMNCINTDICDRPGTSCNKCNYCIDNKDDVYDIHTIVNMVDTILYGRDLYTCFGYCEAYKHDYNNNGYVGITDILDVIKCMEYGNCNNNICVEE